MEMVRQFLVTQKISYAWLLDFWKSMKYQWSIASLVSTDVDTFLVRLE